jgi:hypothetical protein
MDGIPRITSATAIDSTRLFVVFEDASERVYDCGPLLDRPQFALLRTPAFFRSVRVDPEGYGISWNDAMDLGEYELRRNGKPLGKIVSMD